MDFIVAIFLMLFVSCGGPDQKAVVPTAAEPQLPRAEFPAEFPTGQIGYNKWFEKNTSAVFEEMSEEEMMNCATFRVRFIVKKDGNIHDVHVLNDISETAKLEMEAVFYKMPKWKPATLKGAPVDYLCKISGCIQLQ